MALEIAPALKAFERRSPSEIIESHLPPPEILEEFRTPSSLDIQMREESKKNRPGSLFILTQYNGQLVFVPVGHPLTRQSPVVSPRDYGLGVFEGISNYKNALPLFLARMARLERSLEGRKMRDRVNLEEFAQMIIATAEINADSTTQDDHGNPVRAYGRPSIGFDAGRIGLGIHPDSRMFQAVEFSRMKRYLDTGEEKPLTVVASDKWKRNERLYGKFASSYAAASVYSTIARELGADEAVYFSGVIEGRTSKPREGELCDGCGEEFLFRVGNTFIIPPPDNGRLGGTSLAHFQEFTARELKYNTEIAVVTLDDIRRREIEAVYLIGNAVELAPVGEFRYYQGLPNKNTDPEIIHIPNIHNGIVDERDQEIATYYRGQLWGRGSLSSNPHFLTRINRARGTQMRNELMTKWYPGWFR